MLDYGHLYLKMKHFYGHVLKTNQRAYANYEAIGAVITGNEGDRSFMLELNDYSLNNPLVAKARAMLVSYFKCSAQIAVVQ